MDVFTLNKHHRYIITLRQFEDSCFQLWHGDCRIWLLCILGCDLPKCCVRNVETISDREEKCVLQDYFFKSLQNYFFKCSSNVQSSFFITNTNEGAWPPALHAVPLKWKWRHSPISHMNFMTTKRPQQFIYSSFQIGHTHANKAIIRSEGVGASVGRCTHTHTHARALGAKHTQNVICTVILQRRSYDNEWSYTCTNLPLGSSGLYA